MSNDSSEEKSLPASTKKLRDARNKGQVPKSQDLVTGMVILACTVCLAATSSDVVVKARELLELVARIYIEPFSAVWPRVQGLAIELLFAAAWPVLSVTVATVILTNVTVMGGMIFSGEPIKPQYERIDPVQGFKRIFSMRSVIEVLKTLFKLVVLSVAFVLVYRTGLQSLMESARCGAPCVYSSFFQLLTPLVITGIIAFLAVGLLDVLMQRWLFGREMRMTKSDQKRENKDSDGDPLIKRERHRQRRAMQALATKRGVHNATLMIGEAGGWAVAVRYVRGETPVPVIVSRAGPQESAKLVAEAGLHGIARAVNSRLAQRIAVKAVGEAVPDDTFQAVADILVGARLI